MSLHSRRTCVVAFSTLWGRPRSAVAELAALGSRSRFVRFTARSVEGAVQTSLSVTARARNETFGFVGLVYRVGSESASQSVGFSIAGGSSTL